MDEIQNVKDTFRLQIKNLEQLIEVRSIYFTQDFYIFTVVKRLRLFEFLFEQPTAIRGCGEVGGCGVEVDIKIRNNA